MSKKSKYVVRLLISATLQSKSAPNCAIALRHTDKWVDVMGTPSLCMAKDYFHHLQAKIESAGRQERPVRLAQIMDLSQDSTFEEALERANPGFEVNRWQGQDIMVIGYKLMELRPVRVTRITRHEVQ